jgi:alkylhydroperoxidase family enzyme
MAFIRYAPASEVHPDDQVDDEDNILRIHGVHGRTMRQHYELYVELMRGPGPLSRTQREMIAVVVSAINQCEY